MQTILSTEEPEMPFSRRQRFSYTIGTTALMPAGSASIVLIRSIKLRGWSFSGSVSESPGSRGRPSHTRRQSGLPDVRKSWRESATDTPNTRAALQSPARRSGGQSLGGSFRRVAVDNENGVEPTRGPFGAIAYARPEALISEHLGCKRPVLIGTPWAWIPIY